jgi:hypothetical protein
VCVAGREWVHDFDVERHALCLKDIGEGRRDHARAGVSGRTGQDQPRIWSAQDQGSVNRPRIESGPGAGFGLIRGEPKRSRRVGCECGRDLLDGWRRADQPDGDVMGMRIADRGADEAKQCHQQQQAPNHRRHQHANAGAS